MQHRLLASLAAVAIIVIAAAVVYLGTRADPHSYVVAPGGSDRSPGTLAEPFGTLEYGLRQLRPGDTLYVRGGEYHERILSPGIHAGRRDARITVSAWQNERPIVVGLLWLEQMDYWTLNGIHITWDPRNFDTSQHMLKFTGGSNWVFTNAEVWGARSYAAILVTGQASDWNLSWLYVHDTHAANGFNQDQLIYISEARDGVIEHCLLIRSENGRGVKLGRPDPGGDLPRGVVVRFNTFVANRGGAIGSSYAARDNQIYANLMVGVGDGPNVTAFELDPASNTHLFDNAGWGAPTVVASDPGYTRRDNRMIDPRLDSAYRPTNLELLDERGEPTVGHLAAPEVEALVPVLTWSSE